MAGPFVFFGTATAASFLAGSQEEDEEDLRRGHLGLPPRARSSKLEARGSKPYVFETDCIHSCDGPSINAMRSRAVPVTYETMLRHCDLVSWAAEHGYDARRPGLTLKDDWHVGYYRSVYRGKPAYYLVWSAIEFIWTKR